MRDYEIVYIFDASLSEEDVNKKLETFHAKLGGDIGETDHWGVRLLAYPIQKSKSGYYVVVHTSADAENLPEFERLLKLDEAVMRYLVVLNEGQPTTGLSLVIERPVSARDEDDEDDEDEDEDEESSEEMEDTGDSPPEFAGAGGRRRRHEGPAISLLNYKDVTTLSRFITEQGKILPKRTTKVTAAFQRQLGSAVKRARYLALIPYIRNHEG